jgi:hypothetical protein
MLRAPLRAWAPVAYEVHHQRDVLLRALCLGALLLVALYHLGIFGSSRHVEHACFGAAALSLAAVSVSLNGQLAQFVLPHQPRLVLRMPAITMALAMMTIACFSYATTELTNKHSAFARMLNLLANAIKFSEPGTTVSVRWSSTQEGELIEVEDRGIGIAAEHHERIFTSFEQVHQGDTRKYGGTGLGLSISRSLVRMHGGELSLRSELGKGSTFVVRLPRIGTLAGPSVEITLPDNLNTARLGSVIDTAPSLLA